MENLQDGQLVLARASQNPQIDLAIGRLSGDPRRGMAIVEMLFVKRKWGDSCRADTRFIQAIQAGLGRFTQCPTAHVEAIDSDRFRQLMHTGGTSDAAPQNSLALTASWVMRNRVSGKAVAEINDPALLLAMNTEKYEAVPILEHLQQVARAARGERQMQVHTNDADDSELDRGQRCRR